MGENLIGSWSRFVRVGVRTRRLVSLDFTVCPIDLGLGGLRVGSLFCNRGFLRVFCGHPSLMRVSGGKVRDSHEQYSVRLLFSCLYSRKQCFGKGLLSGSAELLDILSRGMTSLDLHLENKLTTLKGRLVRGDGGKETSQNCINFGYVK